MRIAAAAIAGAVLAVPVGVPAAHALADLAQARATQTRLRAVIDTPPALSTPLVVPDKALRVADAKAARRKIAKRVLSEANSGGVLVESLRAAPVPGTGLAAVSLKVSGNEKAVIALVDGITREVPVMRFVDWRIDAVADGSIRLRGMLMAPWHG